MTDNDFDPADPGTWIARGRHPDEATVIAAAWKDFPDLANDAPLEDRLSRTRARTKAMQSLHATQDMRLEENRAATNFGFIEAQLAAGKGGENEIAILHGRDEWHYDWDTAVQYAGGWYAAHAGWCHRGPSVNRDGFTKPGHATAYDRGFTDAGGHPEDIFDAARRANLAAVRKGNQPLKGWTPPPARPLPSAWPPPTDAPRPRAWPSRLLIIADCTEQRQLEGAPALSLFDNHLFRALRAHPGHMATNIVILSAEHGFIEARSMLAPYTTAMTADRATAIAADPVERAKLSALAQASHLEDILVVASGEHLRIIDAHARALPLCRSMETTWDRLLVHRTRLRTWMNRGRSPSENQGAGHIRWGKVHAGLTGKLAELTARYTGPIEPKGHHVRVELPDGTLATGYADARGQILAPEFTVSSKAQLRSAIAQALRTFGAAIRL